MQVLLRGLKIIVPVGFILGGCMELFMIKTGFYEIVTRKEADRQLEIRLEQERKLQRLKELNITINLPNEPNMGK